ncbi:ATPase [Tetragenococcus halophilus]|uniref:ATPase n=1 Tax=Tetragenococcus halophilus TaxID=51669 RepID=A0A3G5FH45_TETHA|nr:V-type ATP synthase subunit E [Tetragenococcus halophilus]AYW49545.1 ATPase [Tetragenococcus halophilus]GBD63122.1 V-type Na(+)-transporting ATPase subunit E [Tetragenococcus halophilus subsp. flandriensis]
MSDITNLTDKITQDAQKKQKQYIKKAQRDIEKNEQNRKKQIEQQLEENVEQFEKQRRTELSLKVSDIHVKARSRLLAARQQLLKDLFAESLKKIKEMSAEDFNQFVRTQLEQVQLSGDVEMVVGQNSTKYATEENKKVWQKAASSQMNLSIAERTIPKRSGFLLRQGEIEYNFTFEAMLSTSEEELSSELLNLIFDGE